MVTKDANLAYPRADRSTALLVIVTESPAVLGFGCVWGNTCYNIPDLEDNIAQPRLYKLQVLFNCLFRPHFLFYLSLRDRRPLSVEAIFFLHLIIIEGV